MSRSSSPKLSVVPASSESGLFENMGLPTTVARFTARALLRCSVAEGGVTNPPLSSDSSASGDPLVASPDEPDEELLRGEDSESDGDSPAANLLVSDSPAQ